MLNPEGRLWIDRLSEGLSETGERLSAADGSAVDDSRRELWLARFRSHLARDLERK